MRNNIYFFILIISFIALIIVIIFNEKMNKRYIYLEECYRVVEECVSFTQGDYPLYVAYKDCSVPPRNVRIRDTIFVEK